MGSVAEVRELNRELHLLLRDRKCEKEIEILLRWIRSTLVHLRHAAAAAVALPPEQLLAEPPGPFGPGRTSSGLLGILRFWAVSGTWLWSPEYLTADCVEPGQGPSSKPTGDLVTEVLVDLIELSESFGPLVQRHARVVHPRFGPLNPGQWIRLFRVGARAIALGADFSGRN